ncbi:MAG: aspartate-semialdehyde dehydrogenase [Nitrospinota bacterium]|nr:aspartate-semialdehyde dehydrogenase [Nitrospinota bacterium]
MAIKKKEKYNVAVVGATGAVGNAMMAILEERKFPVNNLILLASERSEGTRLEFRGETIIVRKLTHNSFEDIDIALFSAGATRSKEFAPLAVKADVVVIDNSSAFRMQDNVPLVVPEVNPDKIKEHHGIIANPNCSTIQMVVVLKPIYDMAGIKRVVVSTYQAVSGSGKKAIEELSVQTRDVLNSRAVSCSVYPYQIAFNCLPHIDVFLESGYTKEEEKMVNETKKIMGDESIAVTATTVRVPVFSAHSESVNIETNFKISAAEIRKSLSAAPGIKVLDDSKKSEYPIATQAAGKDDVFVGRIREDNSVENGINLWIVSDNIRKGAALNAVQIAEYLIK